MQRVLLVAIFCLFYIYQSDCVTSCYDGAYATKNPPYNECSGYRYCEPGNYCVNGTKYPCPEGTYGSVSGLSSPLCEGPCPPGYYCPYGSSSATKFPCGGPNFICPLGSSTPTLVSTGYYSIGLSGSSDADSMLIRVAQVICPKGYYCEEGLLSICPVGRFGNSEGLTNSNCSGLCPEGWICKLGTTSPHSYPCLADPKIFCPQGSSHSFKTFQGYYAIQSHVQEGGGYGDQSPCPTGTYCSGGIRYSCPAGRYGSRAQEYQQNCTGVCRPGYYCPEESRSATAIACGDASVYCPEGSPAPIPVSEGFYSAGSAMEHPFWSNATGLESHLVIHRSSQNLCEPGYYCQKGEWHLFNYSMKTMRLRFKIQVSSFLTVFYSSFYP